MTREQVIDMLQANIGKPVRIRYTTGGEMLAIIDNVDSEGFVHSNVAGPTTDVPSAATLVTLNGDCYWTQFEMITEITQLSK